MIEQRREEKTVLLPFETRKVVCQSGSWQETIGNPQSDFNEGNFDKGLQKGKTREGHWSCKRKSL